MHQELDLAQQQHYLRVLALTPAPVIKAFVEGLLPRLPNVQVAYNRTGLVMLPYRDSVTGAHFHLGEVLLAEAQVEVEGQPGYAACLGRDLEQALAIAILDALLQTARSTHLHPEILRFVATQQAEQQAAEQLLLRKVEATRVELETF